MKVLIALLALVVPAMAMAHTVQPINYACNGAVCTASDNPTPVDASTIILPVSPYVEQ